MAGMSRPGWREDAATADPDELRAFLRVVRRALLVVVRYIEQRYGTD